MIQNITQISSALDKAQEAVRHFIEEYSSAMKKPLKRLGTIVTQEQLHTDHSVQLHPDLELIDKTLLQMEKVLDQLVQKLGEAKPPLAFVFFNLRHLVEEVITNLINELGPVYDSVIIDVPDPTMLFSDRKTLGKLLKELLSHSLYLSGSADGKATVRIEAGLIGGQCLIHLHRIDPITNSSISHAQYFIPPASEISPSAARLANTLGSSIHRGVSPDENILYSIAIPKNNKRSGSHEKHQQSR